MSKSPHEGASSRIVSRAGIWVSLGVLTRIAKHLLIGPMQVINLPLLFTMLAGCLDGASMGLIVGFLSFLASDAFLGIGLWTLVDGLIAGLAGSIMGILGRVSLGWGMAFLLSYILTLAYDILTSWILYMAFGLAPLHSLIMGIIGLFLPTGGGSVFMIGPVTEISTALSFSLLVVELRRRSLD